MGVHTKEVHMDGGVPTQCRGPPCTTRSAHLELDSDSYSVCNTHTHRTAGRACERRPGSASGVIGG